jgi:hypothetical protein
MLPVKTADTHVRPSPDGRVGKTIPETSNQVAKGMASESVPGQEYHIRSQHKCSHTHSKGFFTGNGIGKPQRIPNIIREYNQKEQADVKKVSMNILNDQWKRIFPPVRFSGFRNCAGWGVGPEGLVICTPVIVG